MATPLPIELSSLGMADSLILMILALVVFGPRRLPQIGRQIGKLMYEFRKASNDFKFQMEEELRMAEEADRRKKEELERQATFAAPVQTIEARADIGATETASTGAVAANPAYTEAEEDEAVHLPRVAAPLIQPPSTGIPVAAARPNAVAAPAPEPKSEATPPADASVMAEANIGAGPALTPAEPTRPEPESQHG